MRFVFILISLIFVMDAFGNLVDSIRSEKRKEGLYVVHEVEEEETIYSIARRYKGSVDGIIEHNQITDNRIEIGQIIHVLVEEELEDVPEKLDGDIEDIHVVLPKETLYRISKKYDVKLKDLRKWNDLTDNNIAPGMYLKLTKRARIPEATSEKEANTSVPIDSTERDSLKVVDPFADFSKYLVQTGETLLTISQKIGVTVDSLKIWNGLKGDFLQIGQQLFYRGSQQTQDNLLIEPKKDTRTQLDENGFVRVFEEGVASVIESMKTKRYLALHRSLPIGTNLEVRNLMNNQVVHVKVVGRLPGTGINKNLLLRLSQPAYDQLGILDSKSRVEVSYSKQ